MKAISTIALFTLKEGLRHRVLYGVLTFACLIITFSVLASGMFMRDISKILLDICLASVSLGGLLVPFFLAVNLMAGDLELKTVYSILSLPISRKQYILGKFLGLSLLVVLIMSLLTMATLLSVQAGGYIFEGYFTTVSITSIMSAVSTAILGNIVLLGCVFFWSSITTSSFLVTLLTISTYVIGQTIEEIVRFMSVNTPGVHFSPFFKKAILFLLYIFPNLASFDLKQQAAHGLVISAQHMTLLYGYGLAYITVVLTLTIIFFSRRDLA